MPAFLSALRRRPAAAVLPLAFAVLAAARLHTWNEPLEFDLTSYSVAAREWRHGRALYAELWDHKPPALFAAYAAAQALCGMTEASLYLLWLVPACLTAAGLYAAGAALTRSRLGGVLAAAFWAAVAGDLQLQANQPNTEVFLNACLVWAFVCWLRASDGRPRPWTFAALGLSMALASLFKPVVFVHAAFGSLAYLAYRVEPGAPARAAKHLAVAAAAGLAPWLLVAGAFLLSGGYVDFVAAVFDYNRFFSGLWSANVRMGLSLSKLVPAAMANVTPLLGLAALGLALGRWKKPRPRDAQLLAYAAATFLAVCLPGRFYPHYYQLWLPALCLAGAWALRRLAARLRPRRKPALLRLGAASVLLLVLLQAPSYRLEPEQWTRAKYPHERFVEVRELAFDIERLLEPGERFYQWGKETGLYFYSKRRPPSGILFHEPLRAGPLTEPLRARLLADLEAARPELLVLASDAPWPPPLEAWVAARYEPLPESWQPRGFRYLGLKGGKLLARAQAARMD
ncbi:MAG: hypothetical protein M5U26_27510 [Planctomycetota bacterium]|nr:hypothetical protein [Planctomycetota bacterium]